MPRSKLLAVGAGIVALAATSALMPAPRAELELLAHRADDLAPHRARVVLDLGLVAVRVLVTWSDAVR